MIEANTLHTSEVDNYLLVFQPMRASGTLHYFRSASWLLGENVVRLLSALATSIWVARYLGPSQLGELALILATAQIFAEISTLGLNALLVRDFVDEPERARETLSTAFTMRLLAGIAGGIGVYTVTVVSKPDSPVLAAMAGVLAATIPLKAAEVLEHYSYSQQRMRIPAVARSAASVGYVGASIGFILLGAPLLWFAVAKAIELVTLSAILVLASMNSGIKPTIALSPGLARTLLLRSWPLVLSSMGAIANLKIDQVMLANMSTPTEAGYYAAAARLSEALYFVPGALMMAAFPTLVKLKTQSAERYEARFQLAFDTLLWFGIILAIAVTILAPWLINMLYGLQFGPAIPILAVHVWGGIFIFSRAALSKWILAEDNTHASLMTHGLGATCNIALNLLLIPTYGGTGAAAASVVSYSVSSYLSLYLWRRTWPAARMISLSWLAPLRLVRQFRKEQ